MGARERFAPSRIVTLTTDFGTRDAYVGAMKGVALSLDPALSLHDISHDIEPQNVRHGAVVLRGACPWFPRGTVHVAVVDPGVGTERAALVILAGGHLLVGPDNGLLDLVAAELGGIDEAYAIDTSEAVASIVPARRSATFHGRDVFAPVAAALASGRIELDEVGASHEPRRLESMLPVRRAGGIDGEVLWCDRFGNAVTNIRAADLGELPVGARAAVLPDGRPIALGRTYADVPPSTPIALLGSEGYLEIAVRNGSAAAAFGLAAGARIRIEPAGSA